MIQVSNLTKMYGSKTAIKDLSFTIEKGEVIGFLGPNGAGKSTTMNILTGTLSATSGDVIIQGHNILEEPQKAKACLGYLPENPPLYGEMTVKEYLTFIYRLKKVKEPINEHLSSICEKVKISGVTDRVIKNLSKGYKQRVGMAQALVGNPEVLILDEPTSGMDPKQIIDVRNLILSLKDKHTIIFSSHVLSEIESVCSRLLIIKDGRIVADNTPENLSVDLNRRKRLFLRFDGPVNEVIQRLSTLSDTGRIYSLGKNEKNSFDIEIEMLSDRDIRRGIFHCMSDLKAPILTMYYRELSLEDMFMKVTN